MVFDNLTIKEVCSRVLTSGIWTETTAKQYETRIRTTAQIMYDSRIKGQKKVRTTNWESVNAYVFFSSVDAVYDAIVEVYAERTQTDYFSAFKVVIADLGLVKQNGLSDEVYNAYYDLTDKGVAAYEKKKNSNIGHKSSKVMYDGKVLTWDVIEKKVNEAVDDLDDDDEWLAVLQNLVALIYTDVPPRRILDYSRLAQYTDKKEYEKSPEPNKAFIDLRKQQVMLRIAKFKTSRTFGVYEQKLDKKFGARLAKWIIHSYKLYPRKYLLCKSEKSDNEWFPTNEPINNLSTYAKQIFNNIVRGSTKAEEGQDITVGILRHRCSTWWHAKHPNAPLDQLREISRLMGHSVETSLAYRNLDADDFVDDISDDDDDWENTPIADLKKKVKKKVKEASTSSAEVPSTPDKSEKKLRKKSVKKPEVKADEKVAKTEVDVEYTRTSAGKMNLNDLIEMFQREGQKVEELDAAIDLLETKRKDLQKKRETTKQRLDVFVDVLDKKFTEITKPKRD